MAGVRSPQTTKIELKIFLEGFGLSQLFQVFDPKLSNQYDFDQPNQLFKLNKVQAVSQLIAVLGFPRKVTPGERHFSPRKFIKESFFG